ncbi:hypothetical protein PIB30_032492 [Stylosanthes scabra]|uniref:Late embryogenesis abundant protein LEA-2 subgroup domain-containing protein n=1 Tax=Stylosanthes scabra TaxID=79078 RepID=A0ABU6VBC2_9FABA|nr:hypothetical protein [Stylosanthes scabra]
MGKGCLICFIILSIFLAAATTIVVLGFTVYKPKEPKINVDHIKLENVNFNLNLFGVLKFDFNVTLTADVTVQNPNKIGFMTSDTDAILNYRDVQVGDAPIPAEHILPNETKKFNVTLTVITASLLTHPMIFNDISKNNLPLSVVLAVPGKIEIMGFIKVNFEVLSYCEIQIDVLRKSLISQRCKATTIL